MIFIFIGIFNLLQQIIHDLAFWTFFIISEAFENLTSMTLEDYPVNILLFSETPILSMRLDELFILFFATFYSLFLIVLLYKVTKKVIKKVFGVFKL